MFHCSLPDDNDDSIKDVIRIAQVIKAAERCDLEDHLHSKHAGEDDVTDLQNISELIWLDAHTYTHREKERMRI